MGIIRRLKRAVIASYLRHGLLTSRIRCPEILIFTSETFMLQLLVFYVTKTTEFLEKPKSTIVG